MQDLKEEERKFCQELFAIKKYGIDKWKILFAKYPKLQYDSPKTAIYYAVLLNKYQTVKLLLRYYPLMLNNRSANQDSLAHTAAKMGHLHVLKLLLQHNQEFMHDSNDHHQDVLSEAVENQRMEVISFLLEQHPSRKNPSDPNFIRITEALEIATYKGYLEIVKLFFHLFPVFTKDSSFLKIAILEGHRDLVSFFGQQCSHNIWSVDEWGKNLPVVTAVKHSSLEILSITCQHTLYELLSQKSKEMLLTACVEKNDLSIFIFVTNHYPHLLSGVKAAIVTDLFTKAKDCRIAKMIYEQYPFMLTITVFLSNRNDDCFYYFVSQRLDLYWICVEKYRMALFRKESDWKRCVEVLKRFPNCSTIRTTSQGNSVLHLISMSDFKLDDCKFVVNMFLPQICHLNFEEQTPYDIATQHKNTNMLKAMEPYVSLDEVISARKKFEPHTLCEIVDLVKKQLEQTNLLHYLQMIILQYLFYFQHIPSDC